MTSIRKSVPDGTSRAFLSQVKMKGILDSLLSYWGFIDELKIFVELDKWILKIKGFIIQVD